MPKYHVTFDGWAGYTTTVEIDEAEYKDHEDPEEAMREAAIEAAYELAPSICAQCSGWGDWNDTSLELGEVWELSDHEPVMRVDDDD